MEKSKRNIIFSLLESSREGMSRDCFIFLNKNTRTTVFHNLHHSLFRMKFELSNGIRSRYSSQKFVQEHKD